VGGLRRVQPGSSLDTRRTCPIASIDQGFDGSLVTFLQFNSPRTLWMGTQRGLYSLEDKKVAQNHRTESSDKRSHSFSLLETMNLV